MVRVADLGEHGDMTLGFEGETGFVDTAGPADADPIHPVVVAKRDGLFRRLPDVRLVGVPGI
jgi:hypothetical protein